MSGRLSVVTVQICRCFVPSGCELSDILCPSSSSASPRPSHLGDVVDVPKEETGIVDDVEATDLTVFFCVCL